MRGFGTYLSTGKRSNPRNRCVGKYSHLKVSKKVLVKILEPFFWMDTVCWRYLWELFIPWASIDFLDDVLGGESVGWSAKPYHTFAEVEGPMCHFHWAVLYHTERQKVICIGLTVNPDQISLGHFFHMHRCTSTSMYGPVHYQSGHHRVAFHLSSHQQLRNVDKLLVPHLCHLPFPDQYRLVLGLGYERSIGVTC